MFDDRFIFGGAKGRGSDFVLAYRGFHNITDFEVQSYRNKRSN
jgi:hypothetical protein